ncbi:MAG: efflux RND transporter periplasmic adaptor subunit [Candidatus Aminicenantes bacterium]|nr:MAG: efflux RND transporter periplasmic adaptor subunit [Candidatus Aminicenantes bacterium]
MMIIKKIKIITLLTFFTWLGAGDTWCTGADEKEARVKTGDFVKTIILTGSLKAQESERFVVPITDTWRVQIKWMVKEGEYVNPGDPVVRFDTSTLVTDIESLENSLQVKKEQKDQKLADYHHQEFELEVKLKQAEIDYKKAYIDASIPPGLEAKYEYDKKQLELKKKEQALKNARVEKEVKLAALDSEFKKLDIEIQEERVELKKYKNMLKKMNLSAKTAGTVIYEEMRWEDRKIKVGDTVFSSMLVAYIPDNESLFAEAWVNESDINHIRAGQKVKLIPDAYPQRQFTGTIKGVLNSAEDKRQWGRASYFRTNIQLDAMDLAIMKPGMSVKCIVQLAVYPEVFLVPLEMAHYDGQDFWLKVKGKEIIKVNPLGFNEFHLALPKDTYRHITNEALLQQVVPGEIKDVTGRMVETEKKSEED